MYLLLRKPRSSAADTLLPTAASLLSTRACSQTFGSSAKAVNKFHHGATVSERLNVCANAMVAASVTSSQRQHQHHPVAARKASPAHHPEIKMALHRPSSAPALPPLLQRALVAARSAAPLTISDIYTSNREVIPISWSRKSHLHIPLIVTHKSLSFSSGRSRCALHGVQE